MNSNKNRRKLNNRSRGGGFMSDLKARLYKPISISGETNYKQRLEDLENRISALENKDKTITGGKKTKKGKKYRKTRNTRKK